MTYLSMHPVTRSAFRRTPAGSAQDGPVLLATKPFGGLDAPLAVARWLATREERELHVLSVLEQTDSLAIAAGIPPLPAQFHDEERATLSARIHEWIATGGRGADVSHATVLEGPAAPTIVDAARACDARVIVIGTGKHDPIGRYIYGERALQILRLADRPVLVVPRNAIAASVSVAVVAVDFSPASVRAALAVLPMLSYGGRLVVVHVKGGSTDNDANIGWWNDVYERRCADLFAQFLRQLPSLPGITIETKFLRGDAVHTILEYAASLDAGLLACGRLSHSIIERAFVGSVSSALVRHASCPVLVAPELPEDALMN
jgi:nucleotide-binding universal stress UspA family protein